MSATSTVLLSICILEAIVILWQILKQPKSKDGSNEAGTMPISEVEEALKNNGYTINNLTPDSLVEHLRSFKVRIQNEDYDKAEQRIIEKMDDFLTELWLLKHKRDFNDIANRLLVLICNTMQISVTDDAEINGAFDTEKQHLIQGDSKTLDRLQVIKPAIFYKKTLIKKGKAQ